MTNQELIELVSRAMMKDNAAMEYLYKAYYTDVYFVCKKYNLSDADAADVSQDTFIQSFEKLSTLDNATKFPAWIQRIAANKCLNLLKHNNVLNIDGMYDENEELIDIPDDNKTTEEIVVDKEVSDILSQMMAKLPIEQRVTLFMFYYQDYSIKEIAEAYGCSENTVKSRLNYAKKSMRMEAEKLEEKGIKLRVVSILPFLYVLFKSERDAFACVIPDATAVVCEVMGHAVSGMVSNSAVQGATLGNGTGNISQEIGVGGAKSLMNTGIKTGISKGLIAAISAVFVGVVGVVIAIIIATSGDDSKKDKDNKENIVGKVTTEQSSSEEKSDEETSDEVETTTESYEKETTEEITEIETTTEYVEKLERVEIEGIDYVAKSVVTADNSKADFFWDHTENDFIEWYKSKGYYEISDNPEITIKGNYYLEKGIREYIIKNTRKNAETYETEEYASIYTKTGSYNADEPHKISFRYEGELDKAVENVKEFLEFMGLGEFADELIHSKNDIKIETEDNEGTYTVSPYYQYDKYAKTHILSMEIWYYTTYLPLESANVATGMQYIDDFINLSDFYTESEFDTTSIDTFKNDFHKYMVAEVDPNCLLSSYLLEAEYEYKYHPEKDEPGTLKFEYRTDFLQEGVTFDNNRFRMGYREGQLYIAFPVNAVYDHSVLKFEDMTEDDYIKTSEARCDVLKKLFPSVDFTVEQLVNATKEVAAGNNAPIEFECGGNKCIINCLYDGVSVAIVLP